MRRVLVFIVIFMILNTFNLSFAKEVPFTQEDRDRLIKVEERLSALEGRFDDLQKRFDGMGKGIEGLESQIAKNREGLIRVEERLSALGKRIDYLTNLIYVVLGGMIALIAFVIWDRRTALQPAINKNKELEEKEERIERALKELAKKDSKVAEALKNAGLL